MEWLSINHLTISWLNQLPKTSKEINISIDSSPSLNDQISFQRPPKTSVFSLVPCLYWIHWIIGIFTVSPRHMEWSAPLTICCPHTNILFFYPYGSYKYIGDCESTKLFTFTSAGLPSFNESYCSRLVHHCQGPSSCSHYLSPSKPSWISSFFLTCSLSI